MGSHENGGTEDKTFKNVDTPDLFSLKERTIIVTGATGGMGLQVVKAILESGADVIAIDRGDTPTVPAWSDLQSTAKAHSTTLTYHPCDISDPQATTETFDRAASQSRHPLRGLVNCAGIGWIGPSIDFPIDEAKQIIDVNLTGTLVAAQAAAKVGTPNAAYAASKAGVQQLTRNLASEWGALAVQEGGHPCIRVNSVSPGVIRTPMTAGILETSGYAEVWREESMLKRLSEPEDYRGPVVFLLADASAYVTGADLLVDGGYTAW
ncbi:Short chain dehydrogenases/reductase notP' [Cladobotryum mycophilum]|uniref:Short chain dehydrogenases/reductase notP n=1 Tax=Cladobotryum mycophilum TaxID=491253 RepID=A0ABR0SCY0_9HYPO